jgi:uncharacterized protein (DUF433 family)
VVVSANSLFSIEKRPAQFIRCAVTANYAAAISPDLRYSHPKESVEDHGGAEDAGMSEKIINRDPDILRGTPVFNGTRVPIKILFDHLEAGDSLDVFLEDFPSVSRKQATELLNMAFEQLAGPNEAAA